MEDQRQSRPSGLPRPSRLPVQASKLPKPTTGPALRPSASREALSGGLGSLRNPKLRTTPSRDQLASNPPSIRPPVSTPSRTVSSPHTRTPTGQNTPSALRTAGRSPNVTTPAAGRGALRQPVRPDHAAGSLRRSLSTKTSTDQWISAAVLDQENTLEQTAEVGEEPTLPGPTDNDLGAQTMRQSSYKSRPSLSERTIETLAKLPSSPAVKGRGAASFYDSGSVRRRPPSRPGSRASRPGSSHQSDGSNRPASRSSSRPGSSSGADENGGAFKPSSASYKNPLSTINDSPLRGRSSLQSLRTSMHAGTGAGFRSSISKMPPPGFTQPVRSRTPSPEKANNDGSVSRYGSKTLAARPVKSRPSLNGLFKKPSLPALDKPAPSGMARKASTASQRSSAASCETDPSTVTSASTVTTNDSAETTPGTAYRKSSAALREQIARAKAAKKAAVQPTSAPSVDEPVAPFKTPLVPTDNTFDFGLHADPFSQRGDEKSMAKVLQGRLATARTSGRLNIAAMNLREIPAEVMDMYSLESVGRNDGSWAESVDLTRFVAADNELEMIADSVFPDVDVHDFSNEEESQGNIFGGLETLDLHGNMLIALPMGLRRLELLTSLNLSQNRLANNCLEVISQIKALKDLKLGGNLLYGPLDPCFSSLQNLEILDLHGNNIASLPSNFGNLARLRILNISENVFETIPFEILAELPLTELVARKNQLSGTLIADSVKSMPALQTLDVSANQLVQLIAPDKTCDMPALHQLTLSVNRLQTLPDITGWKNLFTLSADENSINAFPEGFTKLEKLRSVDFSSNDIRVIPAEVGLMDNLSMLRLSGNPLRDKKFCSASTDELKSTLAQRLEPSMVYHEAQDFGGAAPGQMGGQNIAKAVGAEDDDDDDDQDDFATPPTSAPGSPARQRSQTLTGQTWPVKSGGVLDRSKTESSSLHPVICSKVAAAHKIRDVQLHHNLFTTMPDSLSFFADTLTSLSMAKNQLLGEEYLTADLELPELKELNLADNKITSLAPLAAHLRAPNLVKIDVSLNRIATLPAGHLRDIFPKLEILLVSNNHLAELDPECLKGLRIVNASNNDIAHLNPRLGLLDLESLLVTGNRFRVPKWNVLDRGTEATLRWLRSRVPLAELAEWREQGGHADDVD